MEIGLDLRYVLLSELREKWKIQMGNFLLAIPKLKACELTCFVLFCCESNGIKNNQDDVNCNKANEDTIAEVRIYIKKVGMIST